MLRHLSSRSRGLRAQNSFMVSVSQRHGPLAFGNHIREPARCERVADRAHVRDPGLPQLRGQAVTRALRADPQHLTGAHALLVPAIVVMTQHDVAILGTIDEHRGLRDDVVLARVLRNVQI